MTQSEKVKIVSKILKKRFNNLSADELIHISFQIVESLDEPVSKVEVKPNE
jgi:hypothetical protein